MNTKIKGDYSVSLCATHFLAKEYQVLMPYGDRGHYDIVVEKDGVFQRVQCKWTSFMNKKQGCYVVSLRVCGGVRKGENGISLNVIHKYKLMDFDLLWVATPTACYLIPFAEVLQNKEFKSDLKLYPKWDKYRVIVTIPTPSEEDSDFKRRSPRLTNEDKATIKRLIKEGMSEQNIADSIGVTRSCISAFKYRSKGCAK